jgi:hypothetical protein
MSRRAFALDTLLAQIDAKFPTRTKISDGWIASTAHLNRTGAGAKKSQHNPNESDVVCAIDITEDLNVGLDCNRLMEELDASNDDRIFYLIHDREIDNSDDSRTPYRGSNGHITHLHISVVFTDSAKYDDRRAWNLPMLSTVVTPVTPVPPAPPRPAGRPTIKLGSQGQPVTDLQATLVKVFPAYRKLTGNRLLKVDGDFGPKTDIWVCEFQRRTGLTVDGVVGPKTWAKLGL